MYKSEGEPWGGKRGRGAWGETSRGGGGADGGKAAEGGEAHEGRRRGEGEEQRGAAPPPSTVSYLLGEFDQVGSPLLDPFGIVLTS